MENRPILPTRELSLRKTLTQPRVLGFHEMIALASRRNCSPTPSDSMDEDWPSFPSSRVAVVASDDAGSVTTSRKTRAKGRPPKKQNKSTNEGSRKRQVSRKARKPRNAPPAKKRRGRKQPKATEPPPQSSSTTPPPSIVDPGIGGEPSSPAPSHHGSQNMRSYVVTPSTSVAANPSPTPTPMDFSAAEGEGDTTENLEGQEEGELPTLKKMFEQVWLKYYASIDRLTGEQMDEALNIFLERVLTTDEVE